jgi:hypothetical protein
LLSLFELGQPQQIQHLRFESLGDGLVEDQFGSLFAFEQLAQLGVEPGQRRAGLLLVALQAPLLVGDLDDQVVELLAPGLRLGGDGWLAFQALADGFKLAQLRGQDFGRLLVIAPV